MRNSTIKRTLVLLFCLIFCFCAACSAFYIVTQSNHHCPGAHCDICSNLQMCTGIIRLSALGAIAAVAVYASVRIKQAVSYLSIAGCKFLTPVMLKVKISD